MSVRKQRRRDPQTGVMSEFYIVDFVYRHPNGQRERVRKVPPVQSRKGAEEYERQLRAELLNPTPFRKKVPTFGEYVEKEWLPTQAAENTENTIEEKRSHLDHHLAPVLGKLRLDELSAPVIKRFVAQLRTKKSKRTGRTLSPKTVRNVVATLHRILVEAVAAEHLDSLPVFPTVKVPDSEMRPLTGAESLRVLAAIENIEDRALFLFSSRTGLRAGEQIALRWSDVDLTKGSAVIIRSSSRKKIGSTKSKKARVVYLTAEVRAALEQLPRRGELVFTQRTGKPHTYGTLRHRLHSALTRAGIDRRRWHDLRHSYGTALAEAGIPLPKVQRLMGHSTIAVTMRYVHVGEHADLDAALDGRVPQGNPAPDGNPVATPP